ncbi:MAG TPA: TM0106 family RecB-like putative nuclease [Thermoanaerobaculia bacterium]|nr:TM0106 family RecB-like putative nuclease [Thermoanaerobaculia bacterium]
MKLSSSVLRLSATDLSNHLACRHVTTLDLAVARGERPAPQRFDSRLEGLRERGLQHERGYIDHLRARGLEVLELALDGGEEAAACAAEEAMARGAEAIAQAALRDGRWFGRADLLLRVERPSRLGAWSYEPHDTKLAAETRGGTILQLCVYAELLAAVQGELPEHVHVVAPGNDFQPESFRVADFMAYARRVRRRLEEDVAAAAGEVATYPTPAAHCDVCRWFRDCDRRRREDDHLCLVAGIHRSHERQLAAWDVTTLTAFACLPVPLERAPERGAKATYEALREQARVQLLGRESDGRVVERLAAAPGRGLARLPEPSPGDLFLDLEGARFVGDGGLEYLFGTVTVGAGGADEYRAVWALDRADERRAFEALIDGLVACWDQHPGMHVYHFGHYEPAALKRLMGRHATRETELDRLLRGERFVDLHQVVRQGLRASVESYSIKQLEPFYGYVRETPLEAATRALRAVEGALELGRAGDLTEAVQGEVATYNRDDCVSTRRLRDWLEGQRAAAIAEGCELPRPVPRDGEASERLTAWQEEIAPVLAALLGLPDEVPAEDAERTPEQRARWLLAHCLEFHRREDKVGWWEHFRLADLAEEERYEEPFAIAGMKHEERFQPERKNAMPVDRYSFDPQEVDRRRKVAKIDAETVLGRIEGLHPVAGWIDIKKTRKTRDVHPTSVFLHDHISKEVIDGSLLRLAQWVVEHGIDAPGPWRAARDLLLRRPPRGCGGAAGGAAGAGGADPAPLRRPGEELVPAARRLVLQLAEGVLPLQGPPGSGKTWTGARMIVELVRQGRRVGISANSHKVIANLLEETLAAAEEEGVPLRCVQKVRDGSDGAHDGSEAARRFREAGRWQETADNGRVDAALAAGEAQVVAGTAWLWSRAELSGAVDVLVVDEAGQMALADVLAVSQAARNLVLLGDPQQLEQPMQGSHPEGVDVAALDHLLAGAATMPAERGLFLEDTWRLHPSICAFTSEQFYEGRLRPRAGLERQCLHAPPPFDRSGLYFVPVTHEGNQSASEEEVAAVAALVEGWLAAAATWTDKDGVRQPLGLDDILVVTPYNAQIARLEERLPAGARIGTVDKFQGQEAPVVVYSMATSSPEEAPRGMEFLYSRNRLNVATSRARCACVLVASPRLLEPECRTPHQMRLANALCAYVERAAWGQVM